MCGLDPDYCLKFLMSLANLSIIIIREKEEIRAHMSPLETVPKTFTHDFHSAEILFPLNKFEPVALLGVHI